MRHSLSEFIKYAVFFLLQQHPYLNRFGQNEMENPHHYTHTPHHHILEFETNVRPVSLRIRVAKTADDVNAWLLEHRGQKTLGLDIEWKPTFTKGKPQNRASLLQLASDDDVLLVQLLNDVGLVTDGLRAVLEDGMVRKVGVGIMGDAAKMRKDWGVSINGIVTIGNGRSLAKVTLENTGICLTKNKKIQLSNWENRTLSQKQIIYAALDAWVASESFRRTAKIHHTTGDATTSSTIPQMFARTIPY